MIKFFCKYKSSNKPFGFISMMLVISFGLMAGAFLFSALEKFSIIRDLVLIYESRIDSNEIAESCLDMVKGRLVRDPDYEWLRMENFNFTNGLCEVVGKYDFVGSENMNGIYLDLNGQKVRQMEVLITGKYFKSRYVLDTVLKITAQNIEIIDKKSSFIF